MQFVMQSLEDYISHFPNKNLVGQFITHFQILSTSGSQSCLANEGLGTGRWFFVVVFLFVFFFQGGGEGNWPSNSLAVLALKCHSVMRETNMARETYDGPIPD